MHSEISKNHCTRLIVASRLATRSLVEEIRVGCAPALDSLVRVFAFERWLRQLLVVRFDTAPQHLPLGFLVVGQAFLSVMQLSDVSLKVAGALLFLIAVAVKMLIRAARELLQTA